MTLWELIKKGAEDGLEAVKDGLSIFMVEAGKTRRLLKKRVELTSVQGNVRKAFIRLGSAAYELQSRGEADIYGHEEVDQLIAEIDGYKEKVHEIEREIETIQAEEQKKKAS